MRDLLTREAIRNVSIGDACLVVPICQQPLPESLSPVRKQLIASTHELAIPKIELTLRVALERLPIPDGHCAWEDILVFKTEMHDQQWAFRRFLKDLATKRQSAAEIGDDIEWSMNEYKKAMAIHRIKSTQSFVEVFVISPLEIIENLVKFNWSKIAKGMLEVQKRKVELLESEQKAPGRECAYVFDARRRFGGS